MEESDIAFSNKVLSGIIQNIELMVIPNELAMNEYFHLFDCTVAYLLWKRFPNNKIETIQNLRRNQTLKNVRGNNMIESF